METKIATYLVSPPPIPFCKSMEQSLSYEARITAQVGVYLKLLNTSPCNMVPCPSHRCLPSAFI